MGVWECESMGGWYTLHTFTPVSGVKEGRLTMGTPMHGTVCTDFLTERQQANRGRRNGKTPCAIMGGIGTQDRLLRGVGEGCFGNPLGSVRGDAELRLLLIDKHQR